MEVQLTELEKELLVQVLEERQAHFLHEIAKAEHHSFKATLRNRCSILEKVIDKLRTGNHATV